MTFSTPSSLKTSHRKPPSRPHTFTALFTKNHLPNCKEQAPLSPFARTSKPKRQRNSPSLPFPTPPTTKTSPIIPNHTPTLQPIEPRISRMKPHQHRRPVQTRLPHKQATIAIPHRLKRKRQLPDEHRIPHRRKPSRLTIHIHEHIKHRTPTKQAPFRQHLVAHWRYFIKCIRRPYVKKKLSGLVRVRQRVFPPLDRRRPTNTIPPLDKQLLRLESFHGFAPLPKPYAATIRTVP